MSECPRIERHTVWVENDLFSRLIAEGYEPDPDRPLPEGMVVYNDLVPDGPLTKVRMRAVLEWSRSLHPEEEP